MKKLASEQFLNSIIHSTTNRINKEVIVSTQLTNNAKRSASLIDSIKRLIDSQTTTTMRCIM
jgi:hypothetical protein